MEELITLKRINTNEEASTIIELLQKNDIEYTLEKEDNQDTELAGDLAFGIDIKVKAEDLEKAEELLKGIEEIDVERLEKDYYLFAFSDQELIEILQKPDEWSYNDYLWAQDILKQRGKEVAAATLAEWKQKRMEFLSKPTKISNNFILTAYLFCLFGGIIGYFMGNYLSNAQKILPNGKKIFTYDEDSRKKGHTLKKTGLVSLLILIILIVILIAYTKE